MSTTSPSTTAAASTKPAGSGAWACAGCTASSSSASAAVVEACIAVPSRDRGSAPRRIGAIGGRRHYLTNHRTPAHCVIAATGLTSRLRPHGVRNVLFFRRFLAPALQRELSQNSAVDEVRQ